MNEALSGTRVFSYFALVAIIKDNIETFLKSIAHMPVIDVRSPGEYLHAHIPGAHSLPLFNDEERRIIGTAYKQESREKAIKIGLEAFGKKMLPIVEQAEKICGENSREIAVHCWRGGMRSGAVAWLLDLYGFKVTTLAGGYKSFRQFALRLFEQPWNLSVLGGYTGSNKTGVIREMIRAGVRAVDLEEIANHRGSAFGNLDQLPQPTQEQFENDLAIRLLEFTGSDESLWVEAESQRIGLVNIPNAFFVRMRQSPLYFLDIPYDERVAHIVNEYAGFSKEKIAAAIERLRKKLTDPACNEALDLLSDDKFSECFGILLHYYDRLYLKTAKIPTPPPGSPVPEQRTTFFIASSVTNAKKNLQLILKHAQRRKV